MPEPLYHYHMTVSFKAKWIANDEAQAKAVVDRVVREALGMDDDEIIEITIDFGPDFN